MKYVFVLAIIFVASSAAKRAMPQAKLDESAIRSIIQDEVAAWNAGDAVAYSRHFSADGIFVNVRGEYRTGVQASQSSMSSCSTDLFTEALSTRTSSQFNSSGQMLLLWKCSRL
jgi:ketosteroid isomerase-like protein